MDPALACKLFFSLGSIVSIGGVLIPTFREQIMNYGPRKPIDQENNPVKERNQAQRISDYLASLQVPHTWFTQYYVASLACSMFWAIQILCHGRVIQLLRYYSTQSSPAMTFNQVCLAWLFMVIQGTRRLYESLRFMQPSSSRMWFGLWLVGVGHYVFTSLSVWIEGIPLSQTWSLRTIEISRPSSKTLIAVPLFFFASYIQYICHKHLASLKKYSLPSHPFFRFIICPHYTSECLIYLAIAIVCAPEKKWLNRTVLAGLGWTISNLGVTADSTRKWYAQKFGEETIAGRWKMIPFVY